MRIQSLRLRNFKPLLLRHIKHLYLEFPTTATVFRETTPLPATRTDYGPNGSKELVVEHDGKLYRLISDFSKQKAHSFFCGDVDLNPSGTTALQVELAESILGYTPLIAKLTSFKYPVCDLGKVERRDLLFNTHPSDLNFITKHYKEVSERHNIVQMAYNQDARRSASRAGTSAVEAGCSGPVASQRTILRSGRDVTEPVDRGGEESLRTDQPVTRLPGPPN